MYLNYIMNNNKLTFKCVNFYTLFIYEKYESCLQSKLLRAYFKYI